MCQTILNKANWAIDGRVVMDRYSHFQHVSRLTFQLVSYIFQQLPPEYECLIDSEKFFSACTITTDGTNNKEMDTGTYALPTEEILGTEGGINIPRSTKPAENIRSSGSHRRQIDAGNWLHAPDGAILDTYCTNVESMGDIPTSQLNAVVRQRTQIFTWLDHLESRSRFIPSQHKTNFSQEHNKILGGLLGIQGKRPQNTGMQLTSCIPFFNLLLSARKRAASTGDNTVKSDHKSKSMFPYYSI